MRVFTLLNGYLPGFRYGGPVQSIANMVRLLAPTYQFYIFTRNHDHGESTPYDQVRSNAWNTVGNASVYYASRSHESLWNLIRQIRSVNPDVIYANSFFATSTARVLTARHLGLVRQPVVIAPRGEMAPSALSLKRWKKAPYLSLLRAASLLNDVTLHASTPLERADIGRALSNWRHVLIAQNVCVAPDLVLGGSSADAARIPKQEGRARLVFVSRISKMKNLRVAIEAVATLNGLATLDIFGPIDDESYWSECCSLITERRAEEWIAYKGALPTDRVIPTLRSYDFLILPTLGENFGHVIFEALIAGTPVVLSDRTSWRLDQDGAGWNLPPGDVERWVAAVRECVGMSRQDHERVSASALATAERGLTGSRALEQTIDLFQHAVASGRRPC